MLHGVATRWHENGQKKLEENYKDHKLTGWHKVARKRAEGV